MEDHCKKRKACNAPFFVKDNKKKCELWKFLFQKVIMVNYIKLADLYTNSIKKVGDEHFNINVVKFCEDIGIKFGYNNMCVIGNTDERNMFNIVPYKDYPKLVREFFKHMSEYDLMKLDVSFYKYEGNGVKKYVEENSIEAAYRRGKAIAPHAIILLNNTDECLFGNTRTYSRSFRNKRVKNTIKNRMSDINLNSEYVILKNNNNSTNSVPNTTPLNKNWFRSNMSLGKSNVNNLSVKLIQLIVDKYGGQNIIINLLRYLASDVLKHDKSNVDDVLTRLNSMNAAVGYYKYLRQKLVEDNINPKAVEVFDKVSGNIGI